VKPADPCCHWCQVEESDEQRDKNEAQEHLGDHHPEAAAQSVQPGDQGHRGQADSQRRHVNRPAAGARQPQPVQQVILP
jgi:hypothetical protein